MAFPDTRLPIQVEIQTGTTWTDVTSYVRGEQQVRITRGRQDEGAAVEPTRCSFTLDNNDGRFTPGNPTGPYYGQIGRNTPCRVSVLTGAVYLEAPGTSTLDYAETVDNAALDITGDIDVRVDASLHNWLTPAGSGESVEVIGKFASVGQKSWWLGTSLGKLYFEWSADGTNNLSATSTEAPVIPGSGRLAIRAWLDVDNGSGQNTVTFYTSDSIDGTWTQLGDPVTQSGTTSIFNSTAPVRIGNATGFQRELPRGRIHAAEIRDGDWGPVVADPRFTDQAVGATSFTDDAGRTWTVNGACTITNRKTRFHGEISSWPRRWETKHDVVVNVEAAGIMRRLSQGASPERSAIYREFTNPTRTNIVAYWPMEDGADATMLGSALDGAPAMTLSTSGVTPASYSGWAASSPIPAFGAGGSAWGTVPAYSASNYAFHRFFVEVPSGGVATTQRLYTFSTSGTTRRWSLFLNSAGNLDLRAYNSAGTQVLASGFDPTAINGRPVHIAVELTQDGADIDYTVIAYYIDTATLTVVAQEGVAGTLLANTFGSVSEIRIGQDGGLNGTAVGHVAFANLNTAYTGTLEAMVAYAGEDAAARLYRLGDEESIPALPVLAGDMEMGVQRPLALLELLRECEAADGGILCEGREFLGFRYRDRLSLYSQPAALELNYSGDDGLVSPLAPTDDDRLVRNDRTVQRTGGSSARATLDEGTLSTQAPPDGVGRYDDSQTINLFDDTQPAHVAGWLLHLGTQDATRYPTVKVLLQAATHMIDTVAVLDTGDRFRITDPPAWEPPDMGWIDLMVQGYTEVMDQHRWELEFNCAPAGGWDIAWTGDADSASYEREFGWLDTAGSQLAEDLTDTETAVDLHTSTGPRWTDDVSDTPYDVRVGGEVMTVTAPHSLINTNPFFDTDVSDWSVENSTLTRDTTYVCPHPRATASMLITPTGGAAFVGAQAGITAVDSITPGATYTVGFWAWSVDGWPDIRPTVSWYTSGAVFISTVSATATAVGSSLWTYFEADFVAPATASRAQGRVRMGSTPAASDRLWVWAARITRSKASAVYDTFGRTVASGWGTADSGQAWTVVGTAAEYSTNSTYGITSHPSTGISHLALTAAPAADIDLQVDVAASALATGASLFTGPILRAADNNNLYQARVELTTSNTVLLTVRKRVAGVETQLGSGFTTAITHVAGTFYRVRMQASGTALRAKIWRVDGIEPDAWHVDTTDSSLTAAANIGVRCFRNTGNTNAGAELRFDNFEVLNPQTYTVTRSRNGVSKTHSAGADVAPARPAILPL